MEYLERVSENLDSYKLLREEIRNDKEFILELLLLCGDVNFLEYISEELKRDKVFVVKMIENFDSYVLDYISGDLLNNIEMAKEFIKLDPHCYEYFSEQIKNDKDFIKYCLSINIGVIYYIAEEYLDDFDIGLFLVKKNGTNLRYLSERLKDNDEIVRIAIKTYQLYCSDCEYDIKFRKTVPIKYATDRIRRDRDIALESVKYNGYSLFYLPEFKDDIDIVTAAVTNLGYSLKYASNDMRINEMLIYKSIMSCERNNADYKFDEYIFPYDKYVIPHDYWDIYESIEDLKNELCEIYKEN